MASKASIVLTEAQIKRLIAHRHPFLFVKHAIQNRVGHSITTVANLAPQPMLSSQIQMLEGLGQTSALLLRQMPKFEDKPLPVFAAMKDVKWEPRLPDYEDLLFTATMKRMSTSRFGIVEAVAHQKDGETICSGQLTFSFID